MAIYLAAKTSNLFTITPISRTAWDALRAFLATKPQNRTYLPQKTPQNAADEFWDHE